MGEPLRVDPAALSGAGSSVAGLSAGVEAAVSSLTAAYNADTGQDAAGAAFGLAYQDSAKALVSAVAKGVNALRHVGYLIQGSAAIYSRAEAAADISGAASPLPLPVEPPAYAAPGRTPDVNGPGQIAPILWYLVEALVGDVWPNGEPSELRAAAAAWNAFAAPLNAVTGQNAGATATIGAQQMPARERMQTAVHEIGTAMASLAGEAQQLANQLSSFASDVEATQNAIRDLLNKLASVVGSIFDKGILGTVIELVTDDAEEKIREVANDIKAVVANHKRQSAARKDLLAQLVNGITNYSRAIEILLRVEMVNYLGEDAGRVAANITDAFTDTMTGVGLQAINAVGGLATGFDPIGDPKGTWETIEGLGRQALTLNPMTAPVAFATDPHGSIDIVKDLTHFDDIVTSDRPFLGVGKLGFDVATIGVPGGSAAKAGAAARAAERAAARGELPTTERVEIDSPGMRPAAGDVNAVEQGADGVTAKLDELNKTTLDSGQSPAGSPGPLPKSPEPGGPLAPRDPVPSDSGPGPTGGRPTSAPTSADPVPSPVTHAADGNSAPKGEVHSAPGVSEGATSPAGAPGSGHAEAGQPAPAGSPAEGSLGGASSHSSDATASAGGAPGDRVPALVGAHGAEGAADGAGHGPHLGVGGGGSHGGSAEHGGGGGDHGHGGGHGEPPNHGPRDGNSGSDGHGPGPDVATGGDAAGGRDLLRAHEAGEHWTPVDNGPDNPHYGEPLEHPGSSPDPAPITDVNRDTWRLFEHPDELYGHDANGHALTKEQYDARYRELQPNGEVWDNYPPNTGAAADTRVRFSSIRAVIEHFGSKLDRIGWPGGEYLGIMENGVPAAFEARGLPIGSLDKPYYQYTLTGLLPDGWSVEVSEIAPAFGRDGGGMQLVFFNSRGVAVSVEDLIKGKVLE
ncbi:hypothetical protein MANY_52910 [Mycolicibacterium anyangense]|uniref:DUF4237 domain-containing protein n=1 Tax=Mycolicibacterium anyangense TaxID=1431246 RepID=A0A6N4WIR5_9MYCO|nr:glycohydrolase toxin TNT-related protein [Mycolicibacterium anyangense]BBZ79954.1 hypothetical protein MANY_52910 [Mycolicibacterium anyangense]